MTKKDSGAYAKAGVNIDEATKAVELMKPHVRSTYNSRVVTDVGSFGGMYDVSFLEKKYEHPILVESIDGLGTKMNVAEMMNRYTVGQCIVNHCVNDILVQGAIPLTFKNYIALAKLKSKVVEQIVAEMAIACKYNNVPMIAGETAEMPGGQGEVVGCVTAVVERDKIIDGSKIAKDDALIGLPSSGLHTNGYSLARKAFFETRSYTVNTYIPELGHSVGKELLRVHKSYFNELTFLFENDVEIHGIAHITGGGFFDNIGRLLNDKLKAEISTKWTIPPVFRLIQEIENVSDEEMRKVFNLGFGMVLIVPQEQITNIANIFNYNGNSPSWMWLGRIVERESDEKKVVFKKGERK
ncbi:phosphoribosylformylglycinamidine cyclo-ligase [Patescibacteria group bacterium]